MDDVRSLDRPADAAGYDTDFYAWARVEKSARRDSGSLAEMAVPASAPWEKLVKHYCKTAPRAGGCFAGKPQLAPDGAHRNRCIVSYAIQKAASEANLPLATFPASCPWTPEQIIDEDWMPTD